MNKYRPFVPLAFYVSRAIDCCSWAEAEKFVGTQNNDRGLLEPHRRRVYEPLKDTLRDELELSNEKWRKTGVPPPRNE